MQSKYYDESINSSFLSEFGLSQETLYSLQLGLKHQKRRLTFSQ
jgi:hypothetical protein